MRLKYDKTTDTLHLILRPAAGETLQYESGPISALIDEEDELAELAITKAQRFLAQMIAAGVTVEAQPQTPKSKTSAWEDVDSSMISAFRYDEQAETLDVVFTSSGVYRYYEVPADVVEGLRQASSKGSYMRAMIIDQYADEKLRGVRRS
jgi:uncharacterized protein YuzE